ncbi:MAG TPA: AMP-dependent synthetase [Alphaproteobacteria bacterium]|nr:AMP-dependent synthetase [Alphaproteobacteria bacterium]HIO02800.1 AMP-dependent synthetase [Alphaproteobacteria bacterium]
MQNTIINLLHNGAADAPAIVAPDTEALNYATFKLHVTKVVAALKTFGVGRGDRVAIVLPNGPHMASAFVSIAAGATAAPLNPSYRAEEFSFFLSDLNARVLVIMAGFESPARAVAADHGIPVIELEPDNQVTGLFELYPKAATPLVSKSPVVVNDTALVLHTSGTTSRPKIVPLSHRNLTASAQHIGETLALSANDCCLNIMPLFHIHGLIAAVLASLAAGGSVACTPGFNALKFFAWMADFKPTWYTAVPTMHQAILTRASRNRETIESNPLRFIRSSSSSLPPQVMRELEDTFSAPVIESYGMTEAAHQMASNPLPPSSRKPGTVGPAAGPEVAIMDEIGTVLSAGIIGEIVIRGSNVTQGYERNPAANAAAFTKGWFRTGDQGVIDEDGYLTITGRLKEIINRGGEKISPREVDEVLMDHPAVAQVVTFAVPHEKLGEDVAVAVVLAEGADADSDVLRAFVRQRLADFKVPRQVVFLDEIPKGQTGKLQRIGLAEKIGLVK